LYRAGAINWLVVPVGADAVKEILFGTLLMSAPALIARSECIIKINLFLASTVVLAAIWLSFSAARRSCFGTSTIFAVLFVGFVTLVGFLTC
jgi:uncharacterized membrane protein